MPEFTSPTSRSLIVAVLAYLLGSIPFGVVITRAMGLGDLRKIGSGNIGATNVLRTGNKARRRRDPDARRGQGRRRRADRPRVGRRGCGAGGGLSAFLGHLYPVWLGFKGGKGVATFLGTLLALAWPVGLAACATWAVTAAITRISSLSALVAAALSPLWLLVFGQRQHGRPCSCPGGAGLPAPCRQHRPPPRRNRAEDRREERLT